jgi:hypothetical protein
MPANATRSKGPAQAIGGSLGIGGLAAEQHTGAVISAASSFQGG